MSEVALPAVVSAATDCRDYCECVEDGAHRRTGEAIPGDDAYQDAVTAIGKMDPVDVGYDLWLTRNGHGAGFWARELPGEAGQYLTTIAESFGPAELVRGDDGRLYVE